MKDKTEKLNHLAANLNNKQIGPYRFQKASYIFGGREIPYVFMTNGKDDMKETQERMSFRPEDLVDFCLFVLSEYDKDTPPL